MAKIKEEQQWQAEDDARTLARSQEISKDKKRLKRAQVAAKKQLAEKKKEVIALERIAKKPVNSKIKRGDGEVIRIKNDKRYH